VLGSQACWLKKLMISPGAEGFGYISPDVFRLYAPEGFAVSRVRC
jgi:hypothetical protein